MQNLFSTMTRGRPDMLWREKPCHDYVELLAESLQESMRDAVRAAGGLPPMREPGQHMARYRETRVWFVSSYPLLGALAASFRIVDDASAVRRLNVPVAAVSPRLQEIYINPGCGLDLDEWKFVLAHEFLHAALRHDVRLEDRDPELWNVACDYVVNGWLVEMGLGCPPEFALLDDGFKDLPAEAVYDLVLESIRQFRRENTGDLLYGDPALWDRHDGGVLDEYYRSAREEPHRFAAEAELDRLHCRRHIQADKALRSVGTLGGGNHFIELDRGEDGAYWLIIHSGSRRLGLETAKYYQDEAFRQCPAGTPYELAWAEGELRHSYLHDMEIVQAFAALNRRAIAAALVRGMKWDVEEEFSTVHNYIDTENMILRKGAVSAGAGERLVIPMNMRDGCLLCVGKGNPDWNFSAPPRGRTAHEPGGR